MTEWEKLYWKVKDKRREEKMENIFCKLLDVIWAVEDWIEEHTYQTSPYWTILPTIQVGEKVYLYWLKWGVRF